MRILLNGEPHHLPGPLSVDALLRRLEIDPRLVAVELNRVVVKRERFADTQVDDGAEVEIVAFVGGGSGIQLSESSHGSPHHRRPHLLVPARRRHR